MFLKLIEALPFRIVRVNPEEEGRRPEDYAGISVIKDRMATEAEVGGLYRDMKERTGIEIPALEPYLAAVEAVGRMTVEAARGDDDSPSTEQNPYGQ